jgi:hypothetical protein
VTFFTSKSAEISINLPLFSHFIHIINPDGHVPPHPDARVPAARVNLYARSEYTSRAGQKSNFFLMMKF